MLGILDTASVEYMNYFNFDTCIHFKRMPAALLRRRGSISRKSSVCWKLDANLKRTG